MPDPAPLPTLYGLAACDTTRTARKWLQAQGRMVSFHDLREDGLTQALLQRWIARMGWEKVLNKASTTWRALPEADKTDIDAQRAVRLMLAHPTLVKRPVLEAGGVVLVGFKPEAYAAHFGR